MRISDWSSDVCASDLALDRARIVAEDAAAGIDRRGAFLDRVIIGRLRIGDAERHAARRGAVQAAEIGGLPRRLAVAQQRDATLFVAHHILGGMLVAHPSGRASWREKGCRSV